MTDRDVADLGRRHLLQGALALGAATTLNGLLPTWARSSTAGVGPTLPMLSGTDIRLSIGHAALEVDGRRGHVVAINGTVPGPLLRLREGQTVRLSVTNTLQEETSIHWHGLLVPFQMDGVPGLSFPGIRPGQAFVYEFPIRQSGTYWYHSHSGLQEQEGHYGPIIIDPAGPEPIAYDREHVVVLSDFSFMHPHEIAQRLKQQGGVFNYQRQTVAGLLAGRDQTFSERMQWASMLMDPTDISDLTGAVFKFLINGHGPGDNWTGLFAPGERVRLRFINSAAQMIFNVRIPGLRMTVVQADGQNVRPVVVDEFQIGNAETYDVIVQPTEDRAYTLVSEAIDRSGMGRATLAPRPGMSAPVPPLRERPLATIRDMGMDMSAHGAGGTMGGMDHGSMGGMPSSSSSAGAMAGMDHSRIGSVPTAPAAGGALGSGAASTAASSSAPAPGADPMAGMDHSSMAPAPGADPMAGMDMGGMGSAPAPAPSPAPMAGMDHTSMAGMGAASMPEMPGATFPPGMAPPRPRGSDVMGSMPGMEMNMRDPANAPQIRMGPGVQMIAPMPMDRTGEPGLGLESVGHRVLVYRDLIALEPNPDPRPPARALEIRLTGNMERFMWGFDGWQFSDNPPPYAFRSGERVRITLVNDTMMTHPIHLHGHFFELVHGPEGHHPRKHTVNVLPGGKVTFDITAETGDWAFHCHMLYHMHEGMFQVFAVREGAGA